jgi:hypothetical protein
MKCPSCNQPASSLFRNIISLQGVTFIESIQGYIKCQKCGTLLRVVKYGRGFWFVMITTAVALALFVISYKYLLPIIGIGAMTAIWMTIVIISALMFTIGSWKSAQLEKVEKETPA